MQKKTRRKPFSGYVATLKNEFNGYNGKKFFQDLIAGITLGACLLPLIIAVGAQSVNVSVVTVGIVGAIITSVLSNLILTVTGGGTYQISTPCYALSVVVVGTTYSSYGLQATFLACLISGLLLFIAGVARIGKFVKFIPRPIICGLTFGITFTIIVLQLGGAFGVAVNGDNNVQRLTSFFTNGIKEINLINLAVFGGTLLIFSIYPKKWNKVIPSALILTVISAVLVFAIKLDIPTVGKIEFSIINSQRFNIDGTTLTLTKSVLFPALSIFAITLIQSGIAGERSYDKTGKDFNASYQLASLGLSNIIAPFLGGMPVSTSFESIAVSHKTGAQTRLANLFTAITLFLLCYFGKNVIEFIPHATLSAILIVAMIKMNDYKSIIHYFKRKEYGAIVIAFISFISVIFLSLPLAFLIAMVVALFIVLYNTRSVEVYAELKKDLKTVGVNVTGPIYFASVDDLINKIKGINCEYDRLIIDLGGVTYVDSTALQKMLDFLEELNKFKVISFCGTRIKVLKAIAIDGFYQTFGVDSFFNTFSDAYREKFKPREVEKPIEPTPAESEELKEVATTEEEKIPSYEEQTVKADNEEITKVIPPQN